ncbi:MAG: RICIN domain-containing protein [Butyrivibrio sp.]|nr:RICIN domain-containing protein [Butyrivibrio sp.]
MLRFPIIHVFDNNRQKKPRYVYITSKYNGRCLEVEGASTAAGANVWQWDYLGNANQQWKLEVIE